MSTHSRNTILLATDQQRSVLSSLNAHGPHPIAYTAYGHRSRENGWFSLLGFNGEPPDPLTGCYHLGNGYRQFNPTLMRFNRPDSWSPFGEGGVNAYAYCGGDPRNRYDPNGQAFQPFLNFKIPRPKFRYASKASNELTRTPVSVASNTESTYDNIGSISSRGSLSSNYESIKSYSSVDAVPSVPMHSPPQSISQSSLSSIGPSHSVRVRNPDNYPIQEVTINRAAHGNTKSSVSEWAKSTNSKPDQQLEAFSQIPRPGAVLHTTERLAVQANGVRRGTELQRRTNKKFRAADLDSWVKN